jgi:transmembrane sensor
MNKSIAQYVAEDFVLEDTFRSWVLDPDSPHRSSWEAYLSQNPAQKEEILVAKSLTLALNSLQAETPDQQEVDTMWQRIQAEIQAEPQPERQSYFSCPV